VPLFPDIQRKPVHPSSTTSPPVTPRLFALHQPAAIIRQDFHHHHFLKENMTNYKEHCTKYLSNRLRGSSDWRRAQGKKFNDDRND
jgi:hypothetical protein